MFPHGYLCQLVFNELYISLRLIVFFPKRLKTLTSQLEWYRKIVSNSCAAIIYLDQLRRQTAAAIATAPK